MTVDRLHRVFVPSVLAALVTLLIFVLGLAYNIGLASAKITTMQANQERLQANVASMQEAWQTEEISIDEHMAQIQQTLSDLQAVQQEQVRTGSGRPEKNP